MDWTFVIRSVRGAEPPRYTSVCAMYEEGRVALVSPLVVQVFAPPPPLLTEPAIA